MRISVRVWQTALFVTVILVAMLILSSTLFGALQRSILNTSLNVLDNNASELSALLGPDFPLTASSTADIRDQVGRFADVFGNDVWVYDAGGSLVERRQLTPGMRQPLLSAAIVGALSETGHFGVTRFGNPNVFIASRAIYRDNNRVGAVVVAERGDQAQAVVTAARDQLTITFWIALAISGLLGFVFSDLITRQVKRMSQAALAIAGGDFGQRLRRGRLPDEIGDLADSFNLMAGQLGEAFTAIQGQEREISAVVEAMAEGVVAVDSARVVRHANPVAARLLAADPNNFVGRHLEEVVRTDELLTPIDEALSGRQVSETVDHGGRVLLLHATPIAAAEGIAGAALLIMDITEQKRWEEAQREFIANASHEMRTPIAAMRGFLELLESGAKEKRAVRDEFLKTMQAEVDRLQRLVADLFTLAQLDSGRMRLDVSAQPVEELVGDVVAVMGPLADAAGVRIETDLAVSLASVMCDRDRTVQVLIGFVDNALKHSSAGDTVTVWARFEASKVAIGVRDTGPGVPDASLARIFDRFYRAVDEHDAARRGAGLGLSIAKEIVEAHGSRISVDSRPGEGTDFSFTLDRAA